MPHKSLFGAGKRAFLVNVDGASRGNPGPAAAGWVIRDSQGHILIKKGICLGDETNNRAEYLALLLALEDALALKPDSVVVRSDSELLVMQMTGRYRVKNAGLKTLYERAKKLSRAFASFRIEHVPREANRGADLAANEALDDLERK